MLGERMHFQGYNYYVEKEHKIKNLTIQFVLHVHIVYSLWIYRGGGGEGIIYWVLTKSGYMQIILFVNVNVYYLDQIMALSEKERLELVLPSGEGNL